MFGTDNRQECPQPPEDTPSDVQWYWQSPQSHPFLASSAWDGTLKLWQVQTRSTLRPPGGPTPVAGAALPTPSISSIQQMMSLRHTSPLLSIAWAQDNIVAGTGDKKVLLYNVQTQQQQQIGEHQNPVCKVFFHPGKQLVCSLSWDRSICWWDTRSPTPAVTMTAMSDIFSGDLMGDILAVLCDDKKVYVYNLASGNLVQTWPTAPIHYSGRLVRISRPTDCLVVSGYEGRSRILHFDPTQSNKDFNFRGHRTHTNTYEAIIGANSVSSVTDIHSVTAVDFNPIFNTLLTSGADGYVITWDKDSRQKIQVLPNFDTPINCARFDYSGQLMAVGCGNDWSRGINGRSDLFRRTKQVTNRIYVVPVQDAWIRSRPPKDNNRNSR